jgi:hypothetical protein
VGDWLHNLPMVWMAATIFAATYLFAAAIYGAVFILANGRLAQSFKAFSPGMLSPLGILFGLFLAFSAAQVWGDNDRATAAVNQEASALRAVLVLATVFPEAHQATLHTLIGRHVEDAARREWPMMAKQTATLSVIAPHLVDALRSVLAITPDNQSQQTAQAEIVKELEDALAARRQRILISRSQVGDAKWICLFVQAFCVLFGIALVHSENRLTAAIAMGIFATAAATSVLLITGYDRPFVGYLAVGPGPLLQIMAPVSTP